MILTPFFFFLLAAVFATFAPDVTVSPGLLSDLKLFAEYSAAAYCPQNYVKSSHNLSICPATICPELQSPSIQPVRVFNGTRKSHAHGILTLDHAKRLITISFRGTVTNTDWETNLDFMLKNASEICSGCFVHAGLLEYWTGARKPISALWKATHDAFPAYKTVATGHSLGGALATLCALELKRLVPSASVSLYTYGVPRVGDQTFANFIESVLVSNSYRVTHLNDPVPRLPGRFFGFRHPYPEYHITSPHIPSVLSANESVLMAPANLVVNAADVLVLSSTESEEGNAGYTCSDIDMHDSYFMDISKCVAGDDTPLLGGAYSTSYADAIGSSKLTLLQISQTRFAT